MVPVTVVVEEAVTVTIAMVPELEPVEEAVEHGMTSEMVKEASVVTPGGGSCGFDIKHNSEICEYKKEVHNPSATITNLMGGSDTNCFHYFMNQS